MTSSWGGTLYLPYAFSEQGVAIYNWMDDTDKNRKRKIGFV